MVDILKIALKKAHNLLIMSLDFLFCISLTERACFGAGGGKVITLKYQRFIEKYTYRIVNFYDIFPPLVTRW